MRIPLLVVRHAARAVAVITIALSLVALSVFVLFEDRAERYTSGERPVLFYRALGNERLDDYAQVFGVAPTPAIARRRPAAPYKAAPT